MGPLCEAPLSDIRGDEHFYWVWFVAVLSLGFRASANYIGPETGHEMYGH